MKPSRLCFRHFIDTEDCALPFEFLAEGLEDVTLAVRTDGREQADLACAQLRAAFRLGDAPAQAGPVVAARITA